MEKGALKKSIDEWQDTYRMYRESLISRQCPPLPDARLAAALIGVRRGGKTFMAFEMSKQLPAERVLYYNFEDPLFYTDPHVENLDLLLSVATEYSSVPFELLILDEIQNVDGWERWLRKLIDRRRYRVIITGSSARLLGGELSTALSGRCLSYTVWPLSYGEFLTFTNRRPNDSNEHLAAFRTWMTWGGFPEVALTPKEDQRKRLLRQYLDDIVLKDVISRNQIRDKRALDQIVAYYLTNPSSLHSYNAVKKAFQIGAEIVATYTQALQDAFTVFEVPRFHPNLKVQSRDPKKIYVIDTGLRNVGSRSIHDDTGKLLENLVYLELRRREQEVSYFREEREVDFVLTKGLKPSSAIQVCAENLTQPGTREREILALKECMTKLKLREGLVITLNHEEKLSFDKGKRIEIVPANWWFLQEALGEERVK